MTFFLSIAAVVVVVYAFIGFAIFGLHWFLIGRKRIFDSWRRGDQEAVSIMTSCAWPIGVLVYIVYFLFVRPAIKLCKGTPNRKNPRQYFEQLGESYLDAERSSKTYTDENGKPVVKGAK